MRSRNEVQADGKRKDDLALEVLLDIRELMEYKPFDKAQDKEVVKVEETEASLPIVERKKRRKKRKDTKRNKIE